MTNKSLRSVRARMEEALDRSGCTPKDGQGYFDTAEYLAIQMLDSEFMDFEEGILENYLRIWLEMVKLESS